jgi:hypothetical protein
MDVLYVLELEMHLVPQLLAQLPASGLLKNRLSTSATISEGVFLMYLQGRYDLQTRLAINQQYSVTIFSGNDGGM